MMSLREIFWRCKCSNRNARNLFFVVFLIFCCLGLMLESSIASAYSEPPFIFILMYNGLGSLLLLLVSVWFVDAFELFVIFIFRVSRCKVATKIRIKNKYTQHRHVVKAVLIIVLYFILVMSSAIIGYSKPRTRTVEVPLKRLPRCLDGYVENIRYHLKNTKMSTCFDPHTHTQVRNRHDC